MFENYTIKVQRDVLRQMINNCDEYNYVDLNKIDKKYTKDVELFNKLSNLGLLTKFNSDNFVSDVRLTYAGRHFFEYRREMWKDRILWSIIVPVFVSVTTTVITLLISRLSL